MYHGSMTMMQSAGVSNRYTSASYLSEVFAWRERARARAAQHEAPLGVGPSAEDWAEGIPEEEEELEGVEQHVEEMDPEEEEDELGV